MTGERGARVERSLWKNPGMRLSLFLTALWIGSWIVFLGIRPEARMAGLPMIAWAQIILSALGVVLTIVAIPMFEKWERR
jgi:hypothetical protein